MGGLSIWHIVILAGIALLLFGGRGKLSDVMGDFAKGIKSFREGLKDDPKTINGEATNPAAPSSTPTNKDQSTVGR
jgi:sec-independent protein translocase protein TatA